MRRIAVALFGLIFTVTAALAQIGLPFPGPGSTNSGVAPVAVVRVANSAAQSGSSTSDTVSIDATGCNMLVGFTAALGGSPNMASPTATYNGASMTLVSGSPFGPSSGTSNKIAAFYLANPASGTHSYSASWTNAQTRWSSGVICLSAAAGTISSIQSSTAGGTLSVSSHSTSVVVAAQVDQDGTDRTLTTGTTDWHVTGSSYSNGGGHRTGSATVSISWTTDGAGITEVAFSVD